MPKRKLVFKGKQFCFSKEVYPLKRLHVLVERYGGEVLDNILELNLGPWTRYPSLHFICTPSEFDKLTEEVEQALHWDIKIYPTELITKSVKVGRFLRNLRFYNIAKSEFFSVYAENKEEELKIEKLIEEYGGYAIRGIPIVTREFLTKPTKEFYYMAVRERKPIYFYEDFEKALKERKQARKVKLNELSKDFLKFEEFKNYNDRKGERGIIEEFVPPLAEQCAFPNIVNDVALIILSNLPMNDVLKLRLTSKDVNALCLNNSLWKEFCKRIQRNTPWLPNVDIERVNHSNYHWFLFYRRFMKPLLIDFNLLNRVVRKLSREGIHFKENASKGVTVGAFFDVKRVYPGSLPIGSSKMCGDPDLPEDLTIPTTFSFVCQLNLSELSKDLAFSVFHPGLKKTQFPKKGILYFFVHSSLKRGLVYYYNGDVSKLKRRKLQGKQFKSYECAIKIYEHISMDGDYCIKFIHDEMREWWERAAPTNSFHSLFGYAHPYCSGKGKNYLLQIHRYLDFDFGVDYILYFSFDENIQFNEGFIKVETGTMYEEWN